MTKIAFCFPGQGSQRVGMGQELAQDFPEARAVFDEVFADGADQGRPPAIGCTSSTASAASTPSNIVSPSPTIHGRTAKSNE